MFNRLIFIRKCKSCNKWFIKKSFHELRDFCKKCYKNKRSKFKMWKLIIEILENTKAILNQLTIVIISLKEILEAIDNEN